MNNGKIARITLQQMSIFNYLPRNDVNQIFRDTRLGICHTRTPKGFQSGLVIERQDSYLDSNEIDWTGKFIGQSVKRQKERGRERERESLCDKRIIIGQAERRLRRVGREG